MFGFFLDENDIVWNFTDQTLVLPVVYDTYNCSQRLLYVSMNVFCLDSCKIDIIGCSSQRGLLKKLIMHSSTLERSPIMLTCMVQNFRSSSTECIRGNI